MGVTITVRTVLDRGPGANARVDKDTLSIDGKKELRENDRTNEKSQVERTLFIFI